MFIITAGCLPSLGREKKLPEPNVYASRNLAFFMRALRRIQDSFIFYGKSGEIATNRLEDQEISVLSLHLLQTSMVYVNTLMLQRILSEREWLGRMENEDLRALTPLIYVHINPYGTFKLDMDERMALDMA